MYNPQNRGLIEGGTAPCKASRLLCMDTIQLTVQSFHEGAGRQSLQRNDIVQTLG